MREQQQAPSHQQPVKVTLFQYNNEGCQEKRSPSGSECREARNDKRMAWVCVEGITPEVAHAVGHAMGIHSLVIEDIIDKKQAPKIDEQDTRLFVVLKSFLWDEVRKKIQYERVSVIFGDTYVISFCSQHGLFEKIKDQLQWDKGTIRRKGSDYLAYALIDTVVDEYLSPLQKIGDRIEKLEEEIANDVTRNTAKRIHHYRKELNKTRKMIEPLREGIMHFRKQKHDLIHKDTRPYIHDVEDHLTYVAETVNSYRESLGSLLDLHLSMASHRMNDVMRVLTVITTIFIPLTFITGIYGMNFHNMPEVEWKFGYFMILFVMLVLAVLMTVFFRKKKWL